MPGFVILLAINGIGIFQLIKNYLQIIIRGNDINDRSFFGNPEIHFSFFSDEHNIWIFSIFERTNNFVRLLLCAFSTTFDFSQNFYLYKKLFDNRLGFFIDIDTIE